MPSQPKQPERTIITVNDEPYCIWEINLRERNKEFLDGIDVEYFRFLLDAFLSIENEKRASVAVRMAYHHALETMFTFLGAFLQAPDCVYAWISKCSTQTLRTVITRISKSDKMLFTRWNMHSITWNSIAEIIFECYLSGTEKNKRTIQLFAGLWKRLANEYLDPKNIEEYNSLKHGLRVRAGGFSLRVGAEHKNGIPPPEEEMKTIGHSSYGTTYFKIKSFGKERNTCNLYSQRTSLNWSIEKTALLIQLISLSIKNIVAALQIANGAKPNTVQFSRPTSDEDFTKPWELHTGVISCNIDYVINENCVILTTREKLLKIIKDRKTNSQNL